MKGDVCSTEGCSTVLKWRGRVCNRCKYLKRTYGSFTHQVEVKEKLTHCNIKGCANPLSKGKVKCNMHRHLKQKYGSYDYVIPTRGERFWAKVNRTDSCWLWTGSLNRDGYGWISINSKKCSPHRYSWELRNGAIPNDLHVLHKCDRPACVNPQHLFLGTHKDNMRDMVKKGRNKTPALKGEECPASKLKESHVLEIRRLIRCGESDGRIAKKYNVIRQSINNIRNNKTWKHIT